MRNLCIALFVGLATRELDAGVNEWTVSVLHPSFASYSVASGVFNGLQGGTIRRSDGLERATIWMGSATSRQDLHPTGAVWSAVTGVSGGQQVGVISWTGSVPDYRAGLWSGSAGSFLDLTPAEAYSSEAYGVGNGVQVGRVRTAEGMHASLWRGTPESWVDLNPEGSPYSEARATDGVSQVGYSSDRIRAALWRGTAGSFVDLHPVGYAQSVANAVFGNCQGGITRDFDTGRMQAALWRGTSESHVNLNPFGALDSSVTGMWGEFQVGFVRFQNNNIASVWNGSSSTWESLADALPINLSQGSSEAFGVWSDGSVLLVSGIAAGRAVVWSRSIPAPSVAVSIAVFAGVAHYSRSRLRSQGKCGRQESNLHGLSATRS